MTDVKKKIADTNELVKNEFNRWAAQGLGEEMVRNHLSLGRQAIASMALSPGDRVLDLGCGTGWATRLMAEAVAGNQGMAAGLDVSEEMIARARAASREVENTFFAVGSAAEVPWRDEYFDRILAIESFYYCPDQQAVLRELHRVLVPGGLLFILVNVYSENPHSLGWVNHLKIPVHVRSRSDYEQMLRTQGFADITSTRISDLAELPGQDNRRFSDIGFLKTWFVDEAQWLEFRRLGALLLVARRP